MDACTLSLRVLVLQQHEGAALLCRDLETAGHRVSLGTPRHGAGALSAAVVLHGDLSAFDVVLQVDGAGVRIVCGSGDGGSAVRQEEALARVAALAREPQPRAGDERADPAAQPPRALLGRGLQRVRDQIDAFAGCDAPVLVLGETGTGKELVARGLHERSRRAGRPFIALNCAAVPETLLESELFGHEAGAFTGAQARRAGRLMAAHLGTFFLDEVAELPVTAGAKLLRALELGVIDPLGSDASARVDVRFISATHRNLREQVARGAFRQDLYYRLKVLEIRLPPLRERPEDLDLLTHAFLCRFTRGRGRPRLTVGAWRALQGYAFPGNVRELEHAIQHAAVLAHGGPVTAAHLPIELQQGVTAPRAEGDGIVPLQHALRGFEREHVRRALQRAGGRRTHAARLLGISRKSLWEKMRRFGLDADRTDASCPAP